MGDEHSYVRVSEDVKRRLDALRGDGESYEEALERLLDDQSSAFYRGFGRWSDEQAELVRRQRQKARRKSRERTRRLRDGE